MNHFKIERILVPVGLFFLVLHDILIARRVLIGVIAGEARGHGGGGLYIRPRDFLKLGQLYLDDGVWKGKRLLDPGWAAVATTPYNNIWKEEYGYGWWIFSYPYKGRQAKAYYAGGNGGQYVIVIPELDLNIVGFGGNYNQRVMHKPKYEYVRDYVLPAIIK